MNTDIELRRSVMDELEWEPSIDAAQIGVTAHAGVVTLIGTAKSYTEKLAAERVTKRLQGVKAIANDIEVRLPGTAERTDSDLARTAVEILKWRTVVPHDQIKVVVKSGWVSLEGNVDWQYQKHAAFDAVQHLDGVKGVSNMIVVKPRASATDVKSRIDAAFHRSAGLDAEKVKVDAHDGKVTLHGRLRSWAERDEADRTAWAAPGVTEVENLIEVVTSSR